MRTYIIRRMLLIIPTFLLVTIIVFLLVRFIPGDVLDIMVSEMSGEAGEQMADVEGLRHALGLDVPVHVQYGRWLGIAPQESGEFSGLIQGDLGRSLWTNEPVIDILRKRYPVSIELGLLSLIISELVALPIGVFMANKQDSLPDYTGRIFAITMMSLPSFWIATMIIVYPVIWWGKMINVEYVPLTVNIWGNLRQFLIPSFITGVAGSAMTMRMTRTMMLEVLREDYIKVAWAKGLKERTIILRHAVRNAFIPVITAIGARIPALLGGQIIVEQIFALPGVGRVFITALNQRDYPIISASNALIAIAIMVTNVIVDICYAYMDPRIRYD